VGWDGVSVSSFVIRKMQHNKLRPKNLKINAIYEKEFYLCFCMGRNVVFSHHITGRK
jgi:hypothetical protein